MARRATGADELFALPAFSRKCATQAVEDICRICVQVSPSRSGSAALVCAGLACGIPTGARTRASHNADNRFIPENPRTALLRACIAHIVEIEFLLEAPQYLIINFIVIAHVQQGARCKARMFLLSSR